jgi:putative sigma-54 modulation protein
MQVVVKGKHIEVTPGLRSHAEERTAKLERYLDRIQTVEFILSCQKNWQTVEVHLLSDFGFLRAQERSLDMYESIDLVVKKLEKQLRRFKERLKEHPHHSRDVTQTVAARAAADMANEAGLPDTDPEEEEAPKIVRRKQYMLKPVSPEEAADQMELVGHDFYVFLNAETEQVSVIYRRNDGHYGLIQPTS